MQRVQNQIFVIQDEIDEAMGALKARGVPEDCYRLGTFRERPALFVIVHDGLCSAAPDTMLRNCFFHKAYARASETSAASVAPLTYRNIKRWLKGDDLGSGTSGPLGSQVNVLVGPAVGHDLGFSKCLAGETAELERRTLMPGVELDYG